MTPTQKKIISLMLNGHYLVKWKKCYTLYDAKVNPVFRVRIKTIASIDRFIDPDIKIWKTDRRGRITLNLNMVRRLHGKATLKRLYKKQVEPITTGDIYKRKSRKAKSTANEKINSLF